MYAPLVCKNRPVDVQGAGDSDPSGSPASSSITCTSAPHVIPLHELFDVTRRKTRQVVWSLTRRFVRRGWLIREAGVTAVVVENPRLRGSFLVELRQLRGASDVSRWAAQSRQRQCRGPETARHSTGLCGFLCTVLQYRPRHAAIGQIHQWWVN